MFSLRVISADSGAAILTEEFVPISVVAAASALVEPPFRVASFSICRSIFAPVNGHELVVHELEMCRELFSMHPANVIHVDMSLNGVRLADFTATDLQQMSISSKAKDRIKRILPKLRRVASDLKQTYGVEVLAIGKESMPVRIAELTAGAHAVIYASEKALKSAEEVILGLPSASSIGLSHSGVSLKSLESAEHDVVGYAEDKERVMGRVIISEFNNPCVRKFRALRISPK